VRHALCKEFYQAWLDAKPEEGLPIRGDLISDPDGLVMKHGTVLARVDGDIVFDFFSRELADVFGEDLVGQSATGLYSNALQPIHNLMLDICFDQEIGVERYARYLFGHRHKEIEWIALPVLDERTGEVVLASISGSFVDPSADDAIATGSEVVERVLVQNYLSLGNSVDLTPLAGAAATVLSTMGTVLSVDDKHVPMPRTGIAGDAGMAANKASRPNVLAAAASKDFGQAFERLDGLYNLKLVGTLDQARAALETDNIDIVVVSERLIGGMRADLIEELHARADVAAVVLVLEPRPGAENTVIETGDCMINCVVKPLGEYTIRKALDEADAFTRSVFRRQQLGAA